MKTTILKLILVFLIVSGSFHFSFARIIRVPTDQTTIRDGIQASSNGDTVEVSPGEYFENLNFRGKKIVLTSLWYLDRDTSFIRTTIINGSQPLQPDSASCVIFSHGEDASTILQGFTLRGGKGTKWRDIHNGLSYREGGGILIELSSPVIRYNIIVYNKATGTTGGVESAGGGGIRIGDGNPQILNNIIAYNQGKYGAGIVLNYTGVTIRNNLIANNTGSSQFYGGSAIWTYNVHGTDERIIENNTIVNNEATTGTGGVLAYSCKLILRNNIIWGNKPASKQTLNAEGGTVQATYCDVQNGLAGKGNINLDPLMGADSFQLTGLSPCVDKGDSTVVYNDPEEPLHTGMAKYPARGTVRNDMGAYGGARASVTGYIRSGIPSGIPSAMIPDTPQLLQNYPNPASVYTTITYSLPQAESVVLKVTDFSGRIVSNFPVGLTLPGLHQFQLDVSGLQQGNYLYCLEAREQRLVRQMMVVR
ncbi:MAG: T9SS C-terminal target domain-containing protein [Porphyromonadaceae bacterium]|nr:MAG: T9SS C-terminal target domain-containing protein [Porphyromonadaceae bacterium]